MENLSPFFKYGMIFADYLLLEFLRTKVLKIQRPNETYNSHNSKGGIIMKKAALIIFTLGFILSGSFAQQNKDAVYGDDVYYSASKSKKKGKKNKQIVKADESVASEQLTTDPDSSASILPKSATLYDDYNDYSYSARIKRFHKTEEDANYFDEVYTDPANYDSNYQQKGSAGPDVNLYVGAGFGSCWGSSVSFGWGWGYDPWYWNMGWGWGYPYYGWGWNPWWYYQYPFYPYYWSPYSYGYWNGYYAGYWDGYYGYPYGWNSWDYPYNRNTYYGRRIPLASSNGNNLNARTIENPPSSPNNRVVTPPVNERTVLSNERTVETNQRTTMNNEVSFRRENPVPAIERTTSTRTEQPSSQQRYRYSPTDQEQQPASTRNTSQYTRQQQPAPKYIKPEYKRESQSTTRTQNYTSPTYRQPKSSQEYLSPRTQPSSSTVRQQESSGQPTYSRPPASQTQRENVTPTRTQDNSSTNPTRSYTPTRTAPPRSNSYSTPSRSNSYSPPVRSNSNSAPSRSSSPSTSSPSRSSGSSGGGSFGGRRK